MNDVEQEERLRLETEAILAPVMALVMPKLVIVVVCLNMVLTVWLLVAKTIKKFFLSITVVSNSKPSIPIVTLKFASTKAMMIVPLVELFL